MAYFDFFDEELYEKDGTEYRFKCFWEDRSSMKLSLKKLSAGEQREREEWRTALGKLRKHYFKKKKTPKIETTEDVMNLRVPAPRLEGEKKVTARTADKESRVWLYPNPKQVVTWNFHKEEVENYSPPPKKMSRRMKDRIGNAFVNALERTKSSQSSERGEQKYLAECLKDTLVDSKIITAIKYEGEYEGLQGNPDFAIYAKEDEEEDDKDDDDAAEDDDDAGTLAVMGESKSTHNLLLPSESKVLVEKYRKAYKTVVEEEKPRTKEWCHIAHPVAQLLSYMVDNEKRYGVLTSSTRTYFVYLQGSGSKMKVKISDAFFVGEEVYLRAWACIASLGAAQDGDFSAPSGWIKSSSDGGSGSNPKPGPKPGQKQNKRGRKDQSGDGSSKRTKTTTTSLGLKLVPFQDLELGAVIGFGRNGSVFEAQWMNRKVALKQYDLGKGGYEAYHNELAAYARLEDAWGRLTPEPLFVSESVSGGVRYLGLELGRDPSGSEYTSDEWVSVLHQLKTNYGIRHHDAIGTNGLIITRDGQERMVAIDFEDWSDPTV